MNEKELARAQECAEVLIERQYNMYDLEYMDAEIKKMFPALVAEVRRMREALGEIKDYAGPESRDIDDGWSYVHSLASNALKGGEG